MNYSKILSQLHSIQLDFWVNIGGVGMNENNEADTWTVLINITGVIRKIIKDNKNQVK